MDPVTAAGIGLSVTSLALQVFSGCVQGYQMFIEILGMPQEYEHLRTRLQIEQSRFLHWGESVGLLEELVDEPSQLLQLNHSLVLDILHQIQICFRSCLRVVSKYEPVVTKTATRRQINGRSDDQDTARKSAFLKRTLDVWAKGGRAVAKMEWVMLKKDGFEDLITRLVQYNDRVESFLDRKALEDVRLMQVQFSLSLLQMSSQVDQIHTLVQAMKLCPAPSNNSLTTPISRSPILNESPLNPLRDPMISLALFKAHHLRIQLDQRAGSNLYISFRNLDLQGHPTFKGRQMGHYRGRRIWIEWREKVDVEATSSLTPVDSSGSRSGNRNKSRSPVGKSNERRSGTLSREEYREAVDLRVRKLAAILSAPDKPAAFLSPTCLGLSRAQQGEQTRYALIYEWPRPASSPPPRYPNREVDEDDAGVDTRGTHGVHDDDDDDEENTEFISLRDLLGWKFKPSLNSRVDLAKMLAGSLLYLHAVDWVHKDVRSSSVLYATSGNGAIRLMEPLLSGFEFSRPALGETPTVEQDFSVEHDLYRHPDLLTFGSRRSRRLHDIYSLGLMLAEIALWEPIEEILGFGGEIKRSVLQSVRARMLDKEANVVGVIGERAGRAYANVVYDCIVGQAAFGIDPDEDDEDPEVAVRLLDGFYANVIQRLQAIQI